MQCLLPDEDGPLSLDAMRVLMAGCSIASHRRACGAHVHVLVRSVNKAAVEQWVHAFTPLAHDCHVFAELAALQAVLVPLMLMLLLTV